MGEVNAGVLGVRFCCFNTLTMTCVNILTWEGKAMKEWKSVFKDTLNNLHYLSEPNLIDSDH